MRRRRRRDEAANWKPGGDDVGQRCRTQLHCRSVRVRAHIPQVDVDIVLQIDALMLLVSVEEGCVHPPSGRQSEREREVDTLAGVMSGCARIAHLQSCGRIAAEEQGRQAVVPHERCLQYVHNRRGAVRACTSICNDIDVSAARHTGACHDRLVCTRSSRASSLHWENTYTGGSCLTSSRAGVILKHRVGS